MQRSERSNKPRPLASRQWGVVMNTHNGLETNRYKRLIEKIFFDHYTEGDTEVAWLRDDLEDASIALGFRIPKNLGDVVYSVRYRTPMPQSVLDTQPEGFEWIIEGTGRAKYEFRLVRLNRITPNPSLITISVPDGTPEIIRAYALDDEQALLAIVRYNRLIDIFLGLTTYSLQNHLRTTVENTGQIEIDEVYVGLDSRGCHYAIPVQAKGGNDQISVVQTKQDIGWVRQRFPGIRCRAISAQFMADGIVAMFELAVEDDMVKVVDERHYKLIPASSLDHDKIIDYR